MPITSATEYVIPVRFDLSNSTPTGFGGISRQIQGLSDQIKGLGSSITSHIGGAFAGIATAGGLLAATKSMIGFHTEVQNASVGIGSLVSALTGTDITTSMQAARQVMKGLQADAAAGAGGLNDYAQGFQTILGPALSAGASLEQVRDLNRLSLTAGFGLRGQEGLSLVGMDVQQALTAGVGQRTTPLVNQALQSIGVTNAEFNAMANPKRLDTLLKAFGSFEDAAKAMGGTWDAQSATLIDNLKSIARNVTAGLFDRWTDDLMGVNEWLAKNRDLMADMADNVGGRMEGVFGRIRDNPAGAGGLVAGAAGAAGGLRAGGMLAGAAGLVSAPGALLAAGVAQFAALFAAAAYAAVNHFKSLREYVLGSFGELIESVADLGDRLMRVASSPMMAYLGALPVALAGLVMNIATVLFRSMTLLVDLMSAGFDFVSHALQGQMAAANLDFEGAVFHKDWAAASAQRGMDLINEQVLNGGLLRGLAGGSEGPNGLSPTAGATSLFGVDLTKGLAIEGKGDTNIYGNIKVEIKAERLDDPDVVGTTFERILERTKQFPKMSATTRLTPRPT